MVKIFSMLILTTFIHNTMDGQDPLRFKEEVDLLTLSDKDLSFDKLIVFTGSSSVKFWGSLSEDFIGFNVINRGFGGSTFSDLIHFQDDLILNYQPTKVFIYEGDNDVYNGKTPEVILNEAKSISKTIQSRSPDTKIYFISPKPSVARWNLKEEYKHLNYIFSAWTSFEENIEFIDVWTPMCDEYGNVFKDIFIQDNLHMNEKGYAIWTKTIGPFVKL